MEGSSNVIIIMIKILTIVLLILYFGIAIMIFRQSWLMNRAVKTKLAGLINFLSLVHIFMIVILLFLAVFI